MHFFTAYGFSAKQASENFNDAWNYAVQEAVSLINRNKLSMGEWEVQKRIRQLMTAYANSHWPNG